MQETIKIYDLLMKEYKTYPACNITPEGLTMIAERLDKKYSYEQVERAMGRLAYKAKFFPSLAEIADEIGGGKPTLTAEGYKVKWVN